MADKFPKFISAALLLTTLISCAKQGEESRPEAPQIKSVTSQFAGKAVYDCPITINGSNFSSDPKKNVVLIGDVKVTDLIESSTEKIIVKVPEVKITGYSSTLRVISEERESRKVILPFDMRRCDSALIFRGAEFKKLREGVVWTRTETTWEDAPRSLNVVSIEPSELNRLGVAAPSSNATVSSQAQAADAIVAINGSYFGVATQYGHVKIDGEVKLVGATAAEGCAKLFANGVFTLNDNFPTIRSVVGNEGAAKLPEPTVLCCGPLLIEGGTEQTLVNTDHNNLTHPRTAIGLTQDGRVLFVTVDGRFAGKAVGMPTPLLSKFMGILGARYALNLDGGGSTTMWVKDEGVVNHTCDGSWDERKERKVGPIIYLK